MKKSLIITFLAVFAGVGIDYLPSVPIIVGRDIEISPPESKISDLPYVQLAKADKVPVSPVEVVNHASRAYGWSEGAEWEALYILVKNESGWRTDALNRSSGACGLFQSLPCSKVRGDWQDPKNQANFGLAYIKNRYGSPTRALSFWYSQSPAWY